MSNKHTLWIFPLLTQITVSLIATIIDGFSLEILGIVAISASLPSFLLALVCMKFNYHNAHLFPLAFFSGVIGFFYSLLLIIYDTHSQAAVGDHSLLEDSLMTILFALAYALASMIYSLLILRPFLRKRSGI